jgi:hypothetical protein
MAIETPSEDMKVAVACSLLQNLLGGGGTKLKVSQLGIPGLTCTHAGNETWKFLLKIHELENKS